MTLQSAFAILLCSQRFRPPSDFHKTLAQTYDDVPMRVLDQPLADKIHTPSANFSGLRSGGLSSSHPTPKDPLFADVFVPDGNTEPIDCWLLSVSEPRTSTSLSLPRDMAKITARHAASEATFGSADPFRPEDGTHPFGKMP